MVWQPSIQSLLVCLDERSTANAVLKQKTAKYILRSNATSEKWSVQKGYPSRTGGGCRIEERSANGQENPWHSEGDPYQLVSPSPRHQSATGERTGRQGSGDPVISPANDSYATAQRVRFYTRIFISGLRDKRFRILSLPNLNLSNLNLLSYSCPLISTW